MRGARVPQAVARDVIDERARRARRLLDASVRNDNGRPACTSSAQTEVDLEEVEEVTLVEQSYAAEHLRAYKHRRAVQPCGGCEAALVRDRRSVQRMGGPPRVVENATVRDRATLAGPPDHWAEDPDVLRRVGRT